MEEQILKIIESHSVDPREPFDLAAKEITSHVFEFINWLSSFNNLHIDRVGVGWRIITYRGNDYYKERPIEEVYQYWLTNVKNQKG